jgi:peptidoglycan/xylan/chitin deacetylase (PgdA/CDA1 family)
MVSMLETMSERGVTATFFLTGKNAKYTLGPEILKQAIADGHEIAYHSVNHEPLEVVETWTAKDWINDYQGWREIMLELLDEEDFNKAVKPYARAPYGLFTYAFLTMCKEFELYAISWSADPGSINRGIVMRPGDILLLHVRYPDSDILQTLLDTVNDLSFVPLSEAIEAPE